MNNNNKQQRVRVLQTGELGTVTDQVLMKRGNKPMVYKQPSPAGPLVLGRPAGSCKGDVPHYANGRQRDGIVHQGDA